MVRVHHQVVGGLQVATIVSDAPWNQNCYLIGDRSSGSFAIVDPGFESAELRDAVRLMGNRPELLIVTHPHPDHIGAADEVSRETGLECLVPRADERILRHAPMYAAIFGGLRIRLPNRMRFIDAGESLSVGNQRVEVIPVPGHTPGSLLLDLGDLALTGDTLFREHVGRTDLPGGDRDRLGSSIDTLLAHVRDDAMLLAGHGQPWSTAEARAWWQEAGRASPIAAR